MGWEPGPVLGGRLGAPSWVTCPSPRAAGPQQVWALAGSFLTDQVGPSWLWWDGMWWDMMGCDAQPGACPTSHLLGPSATGVGRRWEGIRFDECGLSQAWLISSVVYLQCGLSERDWGWRGENVGGTRERRSSPWQLWDASATVVLTQSDLALLPHHQILKWSLILFTYFYIFKKYSRSIGFEIWA